MKTLCFTGHRPASLLGRYNDLHPNNKLIRSKLNSAIVNAYENLDVRNFISGMALGVDQYAAEEVLSLKEKYSDIRLTAAVPFVQQDRIWPKRSQDRWKRIIEKVDSIFVVEFEREVSFREFKDTHKKGDPKKPVFLLNKRNEWMIDNSDYVFAVYNGATSGGTANAVKYARLTGAIVEIFNPEEK